MRLFLPILAFLVTSVLPAQSTWTGMLSSDWSVPGNWSGGVPGATSNAIIPAVMTNMPSTSGVASAECLGLTVQAGATVTVPPGSPLQVNGALGVAGSITGGGVVRLVGDAAASLGGGGTVENLEIAKSGTPNVSLTGNLTVGTLTLTSGTFRVATLSTAVLTVTGDVSFNGGVLTVVSAGTIDVAGNVTFAGTANTGTTPTIRCAGNWTADAFFAPTSGSVVLDGNGASQTIGGAAPSFPALTIEATAVVAAGVATTVRGTLSVSGALSLAAGTTLSAEGSAVTVAGSVGGTGTLRLAGTPAASLGGGGTIEDLEIAKSGTPNVSLTGNLTVGTLTLTSGTFRVATLSTAVLTVTGDVSFNGGVLTVVSAGTIDVAGNVTFAGTANTGTTPTIRCAGNWTADAFFAPTSGSVVFDGNGANQTIGGAAPKFPALTIEATAVVAAGGATTVAGTLSVSGALSLATGTTLSAEGSAVTVAGSVAGPGTLRLAGTPAASLGGGGTIENLEIAKSGTPNVSLTGNLTVGSLTLTSGTFRVATTNGVVLTVTGDANFNGGSLTVVSVGTIDVAGNVTFAGTTTTGSTPTIRCAGNWLADAAYTPTVGLVELDGASPTSIQSLPAGGTVTIATLVVTNAARNFASDLTLAAAAITVAPAASLVVDPMRHVRVHRTGATALTVNGNLTVAPGGELSLGPQTAATISATGSLTVVGAPGQPATISGEAGGGFALAVNGAIAARDFVMREMGNAGVVIASSATVAPVPDDFRSGTFDFRAGAPAGAVLLDLRRQAPSGAFDGHVFLNSPGAVGVFNVKTSATGVPIQFTNWSGAFGGPAFENDPSNRIAWTVLPAPPLSYFEVRPGADRAEIVWVMASLAGVSGFEIWRATNAIGPFSKILTPALAGTAYGVVNAPLVPNQAYHFALYATMTSGESLLLATGSTTPYSSAPPPNVYKVGAGAPYATIQDAINAAANPNSVVWVTAGTYPAFAIGAGAPQDVKVIADGAVNVTTAAGPIQISNRPPSGTTEITGIVVGGAGTAQDAIALSNCLGPVVLDEVAAACDGAHVAVQVSACPAVAIQRCVIQGGTGLSVSAGSYVAVSRGSLDSLVSVGSTIEMADLVPGSVNVTPPGSLIQRTGLMPDLDVPDLVRLSIPSVLTLAAFPNASYTILASPRLGFMTSPAAEMPLLLDPTGATMVAPMTADAAGQATVAFEVGPIAALLGFTFVVQVVVLDPVTLAYRFSNVESMACLP